MPSKRKDTGGEDRRKGDSEDAARAARRAARDKAFGRSGGDDSTGDSRQSGPPARRGAADDQESSWDGSRKDGSGRREMPRRELPMAGSASELRRLRKSAQDLPAMLESIECDVLAADIAKKNRLLYGAMLIVGIAIVVFIAASILQLKQVIYVTKFSLLAAPICLGFAINDLCMRLARSNPVLACRILSLLTFGNANSLRNLAHLYMDQGDYAKAEKTLSSSIGAIDATKRLRDYILMHALYANLRAHIGRATEAEQLVRQVLNAAEAHHKERQTNGSAFLLANTLNYAAQLCDVTDKMQDALALARRSVKLLCENGKAPPDITLVALYNCGYYCNVVGEFSEAMNYLTKAQELATKTGIAREGEQAFILSNLAIASLGIGRSTQCKRLLAEAEAKALLPLGMSERPHTYQCMAIYHFAKDRLEYSLQAYEKAIDYCSQQNPKESVFLLRIIKEYSVLLRELGQTREASANEQRVTQIRDTLHTLSVYVPTKKDKKIKPLKVPETKKSRFPIFSILFAGFLGFNIWLEGVRLAPLTRWLFFLTTLVVIAVKLRAKYGAPIKEETSQGAIIAIVSVIPGLRSVVPELSLIPQKTAGIVIGAAVVTFVFVQMTAPSDEMVPDSGLLGQEYLVLGDELAEKESFNKARKAYELASKSGAGPIAAMKLMRDIPKNKQPEEAIQENIKALEVSRDGSPKAAKQARVLWEQCVRKYPDFEYPYVHLAALINPNDFANELQEAIASAKSKQKLAKDKPEEVTTNTAASRSEKRAKAHEAEALLEKALDINPNFGLALLEMCSVKMNLGDNKGRIKYAKKFLQVTGDSDPIGKLTGERILAYSDSDTKSTKSTSDAEEKNESIKSTSSEESSATEAPRRNVKFTASDERKAADENDKPSKKFGDDSSTSKPVDGSNKAVVAPKPGKPAKPTTAKPVDDSNQSAVTPKPTKPAKPATSQQAKKKRSDDSWKKLSPDDTDW